MPVEFLLEPTGSSEDTTRLVMMYDGSGRRISKTLLTKSAAATSWDTVKVTHYTGIGTEIREEFHDGSRENVNVVVNMPQGLGRYGLEDAGNPATGARTFEWYLKNRLGSTMLVYGTGGTSGGLKAAYDYRSFGEQITMTAPPTGKVTENFTGKERDDETGLNYFGARYLDPMLGMWTSVDPARQFASPYLYAGNGMNPMNGYDKDGNIWKTTSIIENKWDNFFVGISNLIGIIARGGATSSGTAQKVPGKEFAYAGVGSPDEFVSGISRIVVQTWVPDVDRFMGDLLDWTHEMGETRMITQTWEDVSTFDVWKGSKDMPSYGWYPFLPNETYDDPIYNTNFQPLHNGNVSVEEKEIIIE